MTPDEDVERPTIRRRRRQISRTAARAARTLPAFAAAVLVVNVIATVVAIVVNLPSQFGIVGTDASKEFLTSGTAISAPLIPVVSLLVVVALGARQDRWRWLGIAAGYLSALSLAIGGYGELTAEPTDDTPQAVLLGAGIAFLSIALALAVLSTAAAAVRRPADSSAPAT